jgi:hypothetical protein
MAFNNKHMQAKLDHFVALGFDNSELAKGFVRVRCSQCEMLAINGTATHEHGCPNATHECNGCSVVIPMRQRYCQDCA